MTSRPRWWRRELALLFLTFATARVGFGVIIIIFPTYLEGSSDVALAIALALYPIMEAVTAVPMGSLSDTRGRKAVFLSGLASMAALTGLVGLTRNFLAVATIHTFMGIAAAAITVSSLTMVTDLTVVRNRGKGMGTFDFANLGGYAVGLILGGRLHDYFQNELGNAFFVTAFAMLLALVASFAFLKEPLHKSLRARVELNPIKVLDQRTRAILPIWLSLTSLIGVVFFLPRALGELGMGATLTGDLLFLGIVSLGIGSIGFGALSDRLGRERTMLIGIVGLFVLLLTLGFSLGGNTTGPRLIQNLPILAPSALATSAIVPSILAAVGDRAKEERRGATMGIYSLMLSLGIAVGELMAGFAHSLGGLPAILYAGAAIFLAASLSSLILLRRVRTKPLSLA